MKQSTSNSKQKKSRNATAAVMVLALGAAVYLNWSFAKEGPQNLTVTADTPSAAVETAASAETTAVLDPLEETVDAAAPAAEEEQVNKNYGEAQMVSVLQDSGTEFFEEARLSRSKARDEALEALNDALKDTTVSDAEKKELTDKLSTQVNNITLETKLETLIKSKGFADCVVNLEGEKANVTVMTENDTLTADEVAKIRDALMGQCTGLDAQDITIVEVK